MGGSGLMSDSILAARPSKPTSTQSRAISMRLYEPKALMRTGKSEPSTFSKRSALPPRCACLGSNFLACSETFGAGDFETLSVICVISRSGDTFAVMRWSSPAASSALINSLRSLYAIFCCLGRCGLMVKSGPMIAYNCRERNFLGFKVWWGNLWGDHGQ